LSGTMSHSMSDTSGIKSRAPVFMSAKGTSLRQPGATPQEPHPHTKPGPKVRINGGTVGSGFQPSGFFYRDSQGVALGWRRLGALPLRKALL
jgi:hypothetical protein